MIGSWNSTDGASSHAGLIGRAFIQNNHKIVVFTPTSKSIRNDRHLLPIGGNEEFVKPGFEQTWGKRGWVNKELYEKDYDFLIVQPLDKMPFSEFEKIFPKIKAKKIQVIHEWELPDKPGYYRLNFDAIICFDHRYKKMLLDSGKYSEEKIRIIPYPCHPWTPTEGITREKLREKLSLPKDALILFSFGRQPLEEYEDYLKLMPQLAKELTGYQLIYLVLRSDNKKDWPLVKKMLSGSSRVVLRCERPSIEELYDYLNAVDIHLVPKGITDNIVVSSTVFQCLGSGTPIIIRDTRYVEELKNGEVVKYQPHDISDLKKQVLRLINEDDFREKTIEAAKKYVEENSAQKIAESFINLYNSLCSYQS